MRRHQRLNVSQLGDVTIVHFRDARIADGPSIRELASELFDLVEEDGCKKLVLSFVSVDLLSSEGLGKLITLHKLAKARGGELKLSDLGPDLAQVFSVTRLDRVFDIEADEARAVAGFETTSPHLGENGAVGGTSSHMLGSHGSSSHHSAVSEKSPGSAGGAPPASIAIL